MNRPAQPASAAAKRSRGIVVAPFRAPSANQELTALAEGLAEDIAAGLARFPYLSILDGAEFGLSQNSTAAARSHGARWVLRGGLRSAGPEMRLSVQLVEVETGARVWSENYDRLLEGESLFELQDGLTDRIVATVGDYSGVIPRLVVNELRATDHDEMTFDDWIMRAVCFNQIVYPPEEHAAIRDGLEAVIEREPNHAEAHAWLAAFYRAEHKFQYNVLDDPMGRSLRAAQRAVELDPTSQAGWDALAAAHFFLGDLPAFEAAVPRAIALNPRNSFTTAFLGMLIGHTGQWERGSQLGLQACALNPHHPEWYLFATFYLHYERGEYEEAFAVSKRINWPQIPYSHVNLVAVCGQRGRPDQARASIEVLHETFGFDAATVRDEYRRWGHSETLIDHIVDGLMKAGFEGDASPPPSSGVMPFSQLGAETVKDGASDVKSIAVLPFVNMSENSANEFFSDGVMEEILTNLSKIAGLHVISRTSAMTYKGTSKSIREIASELQVGTVLEGSVRRAGNRVRVTAQLIEAATDRHLWSEQYDRDLEDIFEVQSEVAVAIAHALEAELATDVEAQIRQRPTENIEAYDLYLQGNQGVRTLVPPEVQRGIEQLQGATTLDPRFASAHAALAMGHLFSAHWGAQRGRPDLDDALRSAERAFESEPSNVLARVARAGVSFFRDFDWRGAIEELHEAIRLDPNEREAHFWLGMLLFLMGRFDEAVAAQQAARSLDPHSPNVASHLGLSLCCSGRQEEGEHILREAIAQHPRYFDLTNFLAIALTHAGRFAEAAKWMERTCELTGHHPVFEARLASILQLGGAEPEARRILDRLHEQRDDPRMDLITLAAIALAERDVEAALPHLNAATDRRLPLVFWLLHGVLTGHELPPDHPGLRALRERRFPGAPSTVKTTVGAVGRAPLVGRDAERALLDRMLDKAAEGRGGLVLLGGEPGVGKTRLAGEILEDGRERGMLALTGHAYEDRSAPFVTASEILEEMVRLVPADDLRHLLGDNAAEISRLLPELRRHFPDISDPEPLPPDQQQRYLFNSVLEFLTRASAAIPMVMMLDDIHWADESSLALLEHLAPRLAGMPLLMVGTYRDAEADMGEAFAKTMPTLVRQRLAERVQVKQLAEPAVADLLAALGGADPPATLVGAVHRGTEGNPFFVEEVFRHLSEEGALFDGQGRWRADLDIECLDVPDGVRLVIGRRLERLSETARKMLTTAAAMGLRFDLAVLEQSVRDPEAILDAIEEAEAARLVLPAPEGRGARYEFSHALVRQTLLTGQSAPRLQRLHLVIADAIEEVHGARLDDHAAEIARHLVAAGARAEPTRTRRFLRLAGDRALAAAAAEEALGYYDEALVLEEDLEDGERAEILFQHGLANRSLSRWDAAETTWHEALPGLERAGRSDLVAEVCADLSWLYLWKNDTVKVMDLTTRGLEGASDEPSLVRCRLLASHGLAKNHAGDYGGGEGMLSDAVAMAEALAEPSALAVALGMQSLHCAHTFQINRWLEASNRALELARRLGRSWLRSNILGTAMELQPWSGNPARAHVLADEAEPLAELTGDNGTMIFSSSGRTFAALAEGDLQAAREHMQRAADLLRAGESVFVNIALTIDAWLVWLQGEAEAARRGFEDALAIPLLGSYAGFDAAHALRFFASVEEERAATMLDELAPRLPRPGEVNGAGSWSILLASVEAAARLGRREESARLLPLVLQLMDQGAVFIWPGILVEKVAGIAAAAGGTWSNAEVHFENALRRADETPHLPEQPEVRLWFARMLLDRGQTGDADRARALLTEARTVCIDIGMPNHLEMIDALMKDAE